MNPWAGSRRREPAPWRPGNRRFRSIRRLPCCFVGGWQRLFQLRNLVRAAYLAFAAVVAAVIVLLALALIAIDRGADLCRSRGYVFGDVLLDGTVVCYQGRRFDEGAR